MSLSNASETALLNLLFNNTAWANIGNAAGLQPAGAAGSFFIALHSADPGETGDQSTNEISYTGYGRIAVARTSAGFTVAGNQVSNAAAITFGECTVGTVTATHFSVGLALTGGAAILYRGALGASRSISPGITPIFAIGSLSGTID